MKWIIFLCVPVISIAQKTQSVVFKPMSDHADMQITIYKGKADKLNDDYLYYSDFILAKEKAVDNKTKLKLNSFYLIIIYDYTKKNNEFFYISTANKKQKTPLIIKCNFTVNTRWSVYYQDNKYLFTQF